MSIHRFAFKFAIIVLLSLSLSACLGGSGSGSGSAGPVSVSITSPNANQIDTSDASIRLQGTASSQSSVTAVSWQNDNGQSGTANGTNNWQTGAIPLDLGTNTITIRAADQNDNVATTRIVVNRDSGEKGSATLSWTAPTQREDGTTLNDLQGFRIHYGRMSEVYDYQIDVDNPGIATYVVENLSPGDWYFSVTAYDRNGTESTLSNEAHAKIL